MIKLTRKIQEDAFNAGCKVLKDAGYLAEMAEDHYYIDGPHTFDGCGIAIMARNKGTAYNQSLWIDVMWYNDEIHYSIMYDEENDIRLDCLTTEELLEGVNKHAKKATT